MTQRALPAHADAFAFSTTKPVLQATTLRVFARSASPQKAASKVTSGKKELGFLHELRSAAQVNFEVVWRIYRRLAGTPGFDATVFQNEPLIFVPTDERA